MTPFTPPLALNLPLTVRVFFTAIRIAPPPKYGVAFWPPAPDEYPPLPAASGCKAEPYVALVFRPLPFRSSSPFQKIWIGVDV